MASCMASAIAHLQKTVHARLYRISFARCPGGGPMPVTLVGPNDIKVSLDQIGHNCGGLPGDVAARSITMKRSDLVRSHKPRDAVLAARFASFPKDQEDSS
jgi:hypothetical protein